MCNAAAVATVAGGAQFGQAMMQAQSTANAANAQAKVATQAAEDAKTRGAIAESKEIDATKKAIGSQVAAMGASGAVAGSGSFGSILENTAAQGEMNALTARSNALREAWGYQVQAVQAKATAKQNSGLRAIISTGMQAAQSGMQTYGALK